MSKQQREELGTVAELQRQVSKLLLELIDQALDRNRQCEACANPIPARTAVLMAGISNAG